MNTETALGLLGLLFGLPGVAALVWAVTQHQFRASEQVKYVILEDETEASAATPAGAGGISWKAACLIATIVLLFVPFVALLALTVVQAAHPASASGALKCPF